MFDFYDYVLKLMAQISVGKILTYKKLAIAMGDEISIRAAGTTLNHNPFPIKIPRHRIIHSNGRICWYNIWVEVKIKMLKKDDFLIENEDKKENAKIKNFADYNGLLC